MDRATQLFEQLKREKPNIIIDGQVFYLVEGDLLLSENGLFEYCVRRAALEQAPGEQKEGLVAVADPNGKPVRWSKGKVLTYAVVKSTFPSEAQYTAVVNAMRQATADWEAVCGVKFMHLKEQDGGARTGSPPPLFDVRHYDTRGAFIAVAFFPTDPVEQRHVFIDPSFFRSDLFYQPIGVLRHELGHVLGFRHEHIRSGAPPDCPQEDTHDAVNLTGYDPKSVMHYFCGGVGTQDMKITEVDREGARALYGPPDAEVKYVD